MVLGNARIFQTGSGFVPGGVRIENGRITELWTGEDRPEQGEDLQGHFLIPGLIDLHIHGCFGEDCSDGSVGGVRKIAAFLAARGITSFVPTLMTLPPKETLKACLEIAAAAEAQEKAQGGESVCDESRILGINMEGPYLSERKCGSQKPEDLRLPDPEEFTALQSASGDRIRIVSVAPELAGAEPFIRTASGSAVVSIGHTCAEYDTAKEAFRAGADHVTHLFNAMPPMLHRAPGVIGAAAEQENVTAELICDGLHVHPAVVRLAFRLFPHRICLISDAIRCLGMPEGIYSCGGQEVRLSGGEARLSDGTIAGSVTDLFEGMRRAITFGVDAAEAVEAASHTPAKVLGIGEDTGSIGVGKRADLIVCDPGWNRERVFLGGREITGRNG